MYLSIPTHDLAWLVHTASRPIPARSTLPAIQGCLIEAVSDRVIFSGTNLDWGVRAALPAKVSSSGSLVVSAKILSDIVRTLPPGMSPFHLTNQLGTHSEVRKFGNDAQCSTCR